MESKKIQWNKLLNYLIICLSFVMASLFIGFCFVPTNNKQANALTKSTITDDYNIYFNSAKTKIRYIDNPSDYQLNTNKSDRLNNKFSAYNYSYNSNELNLFKEVSSNQILDNYSSEKDGNVTLKTDSTNVSFFEPVTITDDPLNPDDTDQDFITYGATHFLSQSGEYEEIFYDEIDNGDFVLLNNYNSHNTGKHIETFYLSFGNPYFNDDDQTSSPIHFLQVTATLTTRDGTKYNLAINEVYPYDLDDKFFDTAEENETEHISYCWYQYFDLRNLKAYKTGEGLSSESFDIPDQQGRYDFTFNFTKYDVKDGKLSVSKENETFNYSFYLLDANNYSEVPTINNANLEYVEMNENREYFYNFTNDYPTLTYNPEIYNLTYSRNNREISEKITSEYTTSTYLYSAGKYFPKGTIKYYTQSGNSNATLMRTVYILTYYNADQTKVEYLYLADNNNTYSPVRGDYAEMTQAVEDGRLDFEYKITKIRTSSTSGTLTTYTTDTYRTDSYDRFKFDQATLASEHINTETFDNSTSVARNTEELQNLLNPEKIPLDVSYTLTFEELGEYVFSYNYNVIVNNKVVTNNTTNSTNILNIKDISADLTKIEEPTETKGENVPFYIETQAYFNKDNTVTINGIKYTIIANTLSRNVGTETNMGTIDRPISLTDSKFCGLNNISATYTVAKDYKGQLFLNIRYHVGTYTIYETKTNNKKDVTDISKTLINDYDIKTKITYSLFDSIRKLTSAPNEWQTLYEMLNIFRVANESGDDFDNRSYTEKNYYHESANLDADKLHIFGSIAYFNRNDSTTDSGYAELKQIDRRNEKFYVSDVTRFLSSGTIGTTDGKFSSTIFGNGKTFSTKDIIVTDVTPVSWKNLSTLVYKDKISESIIYRYPNYAIDVNGNIDYDINNTSDEMYDYCITSTYNKDSYIQFDGLYEIIIKYTYDSHKNSASNDVKTYYQYFTFIIDNSSPTLEVKVKDKDGNYTENLGYNQYTNKDIELSWEIPSYFQNDVYLEITKTNFNNSHGFTATYRQGVITSSDNATATTSFKKVEVSDTHYKVYITTDQSSGHYHVTLHYSSRGESTITEKFTIDKLNISGTKILPAIQTQEGNYQVDYYNQTYQNNQTAQIVNYDFTFRYDAKASGAKIFTYWYQINFNKTSDFDKLLKFDQDLAITTNFEFYGKSTESDSGNQYVYTYPEDTNISVSNGNYFANNNSCIYLFKMVDEAGNECRYVVFYDKTTPRFIMNPEPNNSNHIVNDATEIIWGDYKAIKLDLNGAPNLNESINNYNKPTETLTNIELVLAYINSSSNFNGTKIDAIYGPDDTSTDDDTYYLLLPIDEVEVQDLNALDTQNSDPYITYTGNDLLSNYYFFPTNPIDGTAKTITVPTFDENGQFIQDDTLSFESYAYSKVVDTKNQAFDRFLSTTNANVRGAFGEGYYSFKIYDKQRNLRTGVIWMNLDKTQTVVYANYNKTIEDVSQATSIGEAKDGVPSSASSIYISSLKENNASLDDKIYSYNLTYKFYDINTEFYKQILNTNNTLKINILDKDSTIDGTNITTLPEDGITDQQTYLQLMVGSKAYYIELTNKYGQPAPQHSYPYDINGLAVVSDYEGNPEDIYKNNKSSHTVTEYSIDKTTEFTRLFSTIINPIADTDGSGNIVTQQGLYIFKREYTENLTSEQLGEDKMVKYQVVYVDRNGIINLTNSIDTAAEEFGFIFGSDYNTVNEKYKHRLETSTIQNLQTQSKNDSNNSNTSTTASNLFDTNKTLLQFNLTADKYNFASFVNKFESKISEGERTLTQVQSYLTNSNYFSQFLYKVNLTLTKNTTNIIDESSMDSSTQFNESAIAQYLKGYVDNKGFRGLSYNMFVEDNYTVTLKDNSGHIHYNKENIIDDMNYLANNMTMTFNINHRAPQGDAYGKDYSKDYDVPLKLVNGSYSYELLSTYLAERKLDALSLDYKEVQELESGYNVKLYNTNNETLIITFMITEDPYKAKIDTGNILIKKGNDIIFNRVNGEYQGTDEQKTRMNNAFISNTIDGVTYYAIIIFDNNLDTIAKEKNNPELTKYRLLDSNENNDEATYYVTLNYVGSPSNFIQIDANSNKKNFSNTTYEINIDRIKPMYNVAQFMSKDRYVSDSESTTTITADNYVDFFNNYYTNYYNAKYDEQLDFYHSDLEKYFFTLDYRDASEFVFKAVDFDNSKVERGIYIKKITDLANYKYSLTPDDYVVYNNSDYLEGHPLFIPSKAKKLVPGSNDKILDEYRFITYGFENNNNDSEDALNTIRASKIFKYLEANAYYEIIEGDEAGNYRVYGIYVPNYEYTNIAYNYKVNKTADIQNSNVGYKSQNIQPSVDALNLSIDYYNTTDLFLKAFLTIDSPTLKETLTFIYKPFDKTIYVKNSKNLNADRIENVVFNQLDTTPINKKFVSLINHYIEEYKAKISSPNSEYYTQYGFTLRITFVDRLGVPSAGNFKNYVITYNVAGSILTPKFANGTNSFTITVPAKTGTTNIKSITAYIFKNDWNQKNEDDRMNAFHKDETALLNGFTYTLERGVYKFVLVDNYDRENVYFYEYGTSSTQAGGTLKFSDNYQLHTDGFYYTSNSTEFVFDNTIYNVYIQFIHSLDEELNYNLPTDRIIYNNNVSYTEEELRQYGLSITSVDRITTIKIDGVTDLSKYHIKAVPASIAAQYNYYWGQEEINQNILVYDKMLAIYKYIPEVIIRNLNGNELDTSEHLHLTEDFEVATSWKNIDYDNQLEFNTRIYLIRSYYDTNNRLITETYSNANIYTITQPGEYTAYAINNLNTKSNAITFTRGQGQITMYSVLMVDNINKTEKQLIPSSKVDTEEYSTEYEQGNIIVFNYYTTINNFKFTDENNAEISLENILSGNEISKFSINKKANSFIDIRVNSNLSIFVEPYKLSKDDNDTPYAQFRVYAKNTANEYYTYRFVKIFFLEDTDYNLAVTTVTTNLSNENIYVATESVIKRPDSELIVSFKFLDYTNNTIKYTPGNTIYVDRYYGENIVETLTFHDIDENTEAVFNLRQVGLHKFVIRDLAGRKQSFGAPSAEASTLSNALKVYLINQILFEVNGDSPINNQIFNSDVNIKILTELEGLRLYNTSTLGVSVVKNGVDISIPSSTELTFSEQGYYTIKMIATTVLADDTSNIADQEIITTYNFVIIRTDIALTSFNVSKGTGFVIEKLVKIVNNERNDITRNYTSTDSLLWLTHKDHGNCIFEVTLKYFDSNIKNYRHFTFNVWINSDSPVIISSIPNGTSTKEVITLDFNPGMIYSQIGKCKILVNDVVYMVIDENSDRVSSTISLTSKGTYLVQIVSDDGTLISSYKYTKNDPINKTTQIVLICVAIGAVVLVAVFFLVRRKGKYR